MAPGDAGGARRGAPHARSRRATEPSMARSAQLLAVIDGPEPARLDARLDLEHVRVLRVRGRPSWSHLVNTGRQGGPGESRKIVHALVTGWRDGSAPPRTRVGMGTAVARRWDCSWTRVAPQRARRRSIDARAGVPGREGFDTDERLTWTRPEIERGRNGQALVGSKRKRQQARCGATRLQGTEQRVRLSPSSRRADDG